MMVRPWVLIVHSKAGNLTVALKQVLYDHLGVQILLRPWPDQPEWLPQPCIPN